VKKARSTRPEDPVARKPGELIVLVKGGRFEVDLVGMKKRSIYWAQAKEAQVHRCLWFFKENSEHLYEPYDEEYCEFLEVSFVSKFFSRHHLIQLECIC
jgi:hypothetical protein